MEKDCKKAETSHMTPEETRVFLDVLVETVSLPDTFTPVKGYLSKRSWDIICSKFLPHYPRFNRSSLQNRWDRLKKSYYAHMELSTPVSGSDANGNLPPSAEEERAVARSAKEKEAYLVRRSGCIDLMAQLLEGKRATGEYVVSNPMDIVRRASSQQREDSDKDDDEISPSKVSRARKNRRGSPNKSKKRKTSADRDDRLESLREHGAKLDEKFDRLIGLLSKLVDERTPTLPEVHEEAENDEM
eukprot:TRINITY_DN3450_c0_g1_i2.p2 TRINITY_DN3450_c0_g1~~TRINITY_DN3450_c0_g1_i2.p2  ORF type:complete len:244 (-),score=68.38 TRINITY_DN3450_c0_g1_i2:1127-1858(-)